MESQDENEHNNDEDHQKAIGNMMNKTLSLIEEEDADDY